MIKNRKWFLGCFIMLIALLISSLGLAATGSETIGNVRVQILSSTLVRLEVKGPNGFEDRTTFHITNRNWPGATYTRTTSGSTELIQTADYIVRVPSSATSLSGITITKTDGTQIWAYSSLPANDRAWLPGITDNTWAWAIADTPRMVPASWGYNVAAPGVPNYGANGWDLANNAPDMYVFLPKGNVRTLRTDLINLTGRSELIPLYAFGYWDSRYYAYSEQTALQQIDDYRNRDLPIDVLVIDTDWRVGGSTGYDINTTLFPDMTRFLSSAHAKNVRIMFNDHPEPRASSLDPTEVTFRNNGLRGLLNRGLDYWWFDRNWGVSYNSPASNLQKEIWGMYVYQWIMNDYFPNRRPIIMANCDGIDNGVRNNAPSYVTHRYTMQWTGDIYPDFASLQREVDNAVYNGMYAAFPYTSADLGGHTQSDPTTEGYIRWLQYGSLSPITRPHCTNYLAGRMPWLFGDTALNITRKFVKMRYRLLPLFYTLARNSYDTADPILRRLDFDYPTYTEARSNTQYLLGDGILVAPVLASGTSRTLWIPPGTWIDVWSGSTITGPQTITATVPLEQMPIYVKPGTIVPLAPEMSYIGQKPWDPITLDVYPTSSKTASANMYEDDGISKDYKSGSYRNTQFNATVDTANKKVTVTINPAQGTYSGASANRSWVVRIHRPVEWSYMTAVSATVNGTSASFAEKGKDSTAMPFVNSGGSPDTNVVEVTVPSAAVSGTRTIEVNFAAATVYEAENAALAGGAAVATDHTGYSGTGFVAGFWTVGATTTFTVNVSSSNTYNVTLRFANATGAAKTVSLYVNGAKIRQVSLSNLANWDTWSDQTESVSLNAGNNTIAYKYDTTDTANINLDYIVLNTGSVTPTPTPTSTPNGDKCTGGTISVSNTTSPAGEDMTKAFDDSSSTKWLMGTATGWIQYDFAGTTAWAINQYTITSANDYPTRDPKNWTFLGSNDGTNWTTLDTQTNQTFAGRFQKNTYNISNTTAYQMYRLNITANGGDGNIQLAEIEMFAGTASSTPTATSTPTQSPAPSSTATPTKTPTSTSVQSPTSTSTATPTPVSFNDNFNDNAISSAWTFYGSGAWTEQGTILRQDSTSQGDPCKATLSNSGKTFGASHTILAKVYVNSWADGDTARAGVGLFTGTGNGQGYNLIFHNNHSTVQFLDDATAWGPSYTFNWTNQTWYWFKLQMSNGTLYGKIWQDGVAEPGSWPYTWTRSGRSGYPALNGGTSGHGGSCTVYFDDVTVTVP